MGRPGQTIHLAALKGHPVVVNFWASWCEACKTEEPLMQAAWQKYQAQGVVFVGIAVNDEPAPGKLFMKQYGITYPSGPATTDQTVVDYALPGLPDTIFINRQGVVIAKHEGQISAQDLESGIQALLKS